MKLSVTLSQKYYEHKGTRYQMAMHGIFTYKLDTQVGSQTPQYGHPGPQFG